jgi:hypothetical protein
MWLVGRLARRDEQHAIQSESVRNVSSHCDVAQVGRVERTAEDTDAAPPSSDVGQGADPVFWTSAASGLSG